MSNHIRFMGQLVLLGACSLSCSHTNTDKEWTSCGAPAACGGALDGAWQIDSICAEGDLLTALGTKANMPADCSNAYQSVDLKSTGSVTFISGTETDNVETTVKATIVYTPTCIGAIYKTTTTLDADACATLQGTISSTATCSLTGGNCNCEVTEVTPATAKQRAYSVAGGTVTYSNGDGPMDYCVSNTTMTTSQPSSDLHGVTLVYTLHK